MEAVGLNFLQIKAFIPALKAFVMKNFDKVARNLQMIRPVFAK